MRIIALLLIFSCSLPLLGQYTFNVTSETYEELENPISVNNKEIWGREFDYQIYFNFNFSILDQTYTAINVKAGGSIEFPGLGVKQLLVFFTPFGGNTLVDRGVTSSESPIDYEIVGSEGNRILKVQWKNAGFWQLYESSSPDDYMNFQVWLFENDNHIEVHFGEHEASPGTYGYPTVSDPNPGTSFLFYFDDCSETFGLHGSANLPSYWYFNTCTPNYSFIDGTPNTNLVYNLYPQSVDVVDIGSKSLNVFPNPASDVLFLSDIPGNLNISKIVLHDNTGRPVLQKDVSNNIPSILELSTQELTTGLYYLRIHTKDEMITKKILITGN